MRSDDGVLAVSDKDENIACKSRYEKLLNTELVWDSLVIVIRNGKIVWKHGPYCSYFHLNLKYLAWPYRAYIKIAKNSDFCEELLSENDFEEGLATFCCYDHGTKASEAAQKIATDQKEYRKFSWYVKICWIATIYLSVKQKQWKMVGYKDTSDVAKKAAEVAQKKEQ